MAKVDIAGLLTGVGSAPIDPMAVGGTYEQRALAAGQRASERMLRGFGALTGTDVRTTEQKAQQAQILLDRNIQDLKNEENRLEMVRLKVEKLIHDNNTIKEMESLRKELRKES